MKTSRILAASLAVVTMAGALSAQERRPLVYTYSSSDDRDRAFLGISTGNSGIRDTLGLLITSITPDGPAEKAGLEEGNRIASINGTSLRLSRVDAEDPEMPGLMSRRLIRELQKVKPGDEAELNVWGGGRFRTLKVKTGEVPEPASFARRSRADVDDRAVLGINVSSTGTRRDTLGLFVSRVTMDGPAEKAGIVEGDRIAAINGVDVRVAREDAGDRWVSGAKASRFSRELRKAKAGDAVELRIQSSSGGAARTVRVTTVRAADLRAAGFGEGPMIFGGDGFEFVTPRAPLAPGVPRARIAPMAPMAPVPPGRIRIETMDDLGHVGELVGDIIGDVVPAIVDGVVAPMIQDLVPMIINGVEDIGPVIERAMDEAFGSDRPSTNNKRRMKITEPAPLPARTAQRVWIQA